MHLSFTRGQGGTVEPAAFSVSLELLFPGLTRSHIRRASVPSSAHQHCSGLSPPEPSHLSTTLLPAPRYLLGLESG